MKSPFRLAIASISSALTIPLLVAEPLTLDLSGDWQFAFDSEDTRLQADSAQWTFSDTIELPGSTALRKKGPEVDVPLTLDRPAMHHLHQRHPYIGPAWYQKTVTVPADWQNKDILLTLERVLWESRVWVDGKPAGEPQLSVSVPHRYDLTAMLTPGKEHTLTMRIDNRLKVDIGTIGHAYTEETQSIWNGVIGDLQLEAVPKVRISHLGLRPLLAENAVEVMMEITNSTNRAASEQYQITASFNEGENATPATVEGRFTASPGVTTRTITVRAEANSKTWSEASPFVGVVSAKLASGSEVAKPCGLRSFTANGKQLLNNGVPVFLRGNLECAIFPQTGHPDAEGPQWEKIMRVSQEHGINHLRFHSWCPPEVAFVAANKAGIYLQVELPNWTFEMGNLPPTDDFFLAEGERIFREYGHHPSFVMFSLGNELKGDLKKMDALITKFRTFAPDVLFTSTSYAFSPRGLSPGPEDDFFISQRTASGWVRGQGFLNNTFPSTNTDYAEGLSSVPVPLVTHEVGQYVVYPNLAELPKYEDTPMRSTALEAIQQDLTSKGLLDQADEFTRDSGKLAALLYKEDIERALRTKDLSGIQLLQLHDFPGQSTATVGLLDAFWDSKGLISPEEFRQFSSPVVPLVRMDKFVWQNDETFSARVELAQFSNETLSGAEFKATLLAADGSSFAEQSFPAKNYPVGNGLVVGTFSAGLSEVTSPQEFTLKVEQVGTKNLNTWPIWVYPSVAKTTPEITIHRGTTDECLADLAAGKSVLLLPPSGALKKPLPARFIPVFWSPLHFPNQPGTLGATIDDQHPLWKNFPTDTHTNWQWWELTAESTALDLSGVDTAIAKPFRFVDKYNRNALPTAIFETQVGPGKLLVCTLDVETAPKNRIVARELKRALGSYLSSADFAPTGQITAAQLKDLIGESAFELTASSAEAPYVVTNASDGDPSTIWHTPWTGESRLPATLSLDFLSEKVVEGLDLLPRQTGDNGMLKDYRIEVSKDGQEWKPLGRQQYSIGRGNSLHAVTFPKPVKVRYLRLVLLSTQKKETFVSLAEITPRFAKETDPRDLGIIPGFND